MVHVESTPLLINSILLLVSSSTFLVLFGWIVLYRSSAQRRTPIPITPAAAAAGRAGDIPPPQPATSPASQPPPLTHALSGTTIGGTSTTLSPPLASSAVPTVVTIELTPVIPLSRVPPPLISAAPTTDVPIEVKPVAALARDRENGIASIERTPPAASRRATLPPNNQRRSSPVYSRSGTARPGALIRPLSHGSAANGASGGGGEGGAAPAPSAFNWTTHSAAAGSGHGGPVIPPPAEPKTFPYYARRIALLTAVLLLARAVDVNSTFDIYPLLLTGLLYVCINQALISVIVLWIKFHSTALYSQLRKPIPKRVRYGLWIPGTAYFIVSIVVIPLAYEVDWDRFMFVHHMAMLFVASVLAVVAPNVYWQLRTELLKFVANQNKMRAPPLPPGAKSSDQKPTSPLAGDAPASPGTPRIGSEMTPKNSGGGGGGGGGAAPLTPTANSTAAQISTTHITAALRTLGIVVCCGVPLAGLLIVVVLIDAVAITRRGHSEYDAEWITPHDLTLRVIALNWFPDVLMAVLLFVCWPSTAGSGGGGGAGTAPSLAAARQTLLTKRGTTGSSALPPPPLAIHIVHSPRRSTLPPPPPPPPPPAPAAEGSSPPPLENELTQALMVASGRSPHPPPPAPTADASIPPAPAEVITALLPPAPQLRIDSDAPHIAVGVDTTALPGAAASTPTGAGEGGGGVQRTNSAAPVNLARSPRSLPPLARSPRAASAAAVASESNS